MTFSTTPTVSMTNAADRVEIITSVQRRRRWTASEKVRIVEETFEPGMTVSLVARRHGVALDLRVAPHHDGGSLGQAQIALA
jgi:transposase-like protein